MEEAGTPSALDEADVRCVLDAASLDLPGPLSIRQLSGGYSWRTYRVTGADGSSVVLRIAPRGGTLEPYDPAVEARAIQAARRSVPAPRVLAVGRGGRPFGDPYSIQSLVEGRVRRLSAVTDPDERERYRTTFARTLGLLHRDGNASALGDATTVTAAIEVELARVAARYRRAARWPRPGFEIGLRWLVTHLPRVDDPPTFCHGDYRFGNLAWTAPGQLGGVLDWERAWCGDPMADVAFGHIYSGWCAVDGRAEAEYERAGGRIVGSRLPYLRRLELVRSFTASMLGLQAALDGRSSQPALIGIGAAGERSMGALVAWLAEGELQPLPAGWRAPVDVQALPACRPEELRRSLQGLRRCPVPPGLAGPLAAALDDSDDEAAWRRAFALVAPLAATASADALPALTALVAAVGSAQTTG